MQTIIRLLQRPRGAARPVGGPVSLDVSAAERRHARRALAVRASR
jgi:hypothetical protein